MPFKLLRSPSSTTHQSRISRLSFKFFATGDTQKDSGLEIEFMLDTGASSSIIIYRTFGKICQTQHPISVTRSTILRPSCTYAWVGNVNIQLRPGWTVYLPFNRLDYRNENAEPPRHGLLSKTSIWHPF